MSVFVYSSVFMDLTSTRNLQSPWFVYTCCNYCLRLGNLMPLTQYIGTCWLNLEVKGVIERWPHHLGFTVWKDDALMIGNCEITSTKMISANLQNPYIRISRVLYIRPVETLYLDCQYEIESPLSLTTCFYFPDYIPPSLCLPRLLAVLQSISAVPGL